MARSVVERSIARLEQSKIGAREFAPGKSFQPILLIVGKTMSLPDTGALKRYLFHLGKILPHPQMQY
jgi:hypothetical protein